jgi:hypothetical protein
VGIVPAGRLPSAIGFGKLGAQSLPRDHESYVVRGGEPGKRPAPYWPLVSLLHRAEGLTADEIEWCHKNAPRVRQMIDGKA